MGDTFTHWGVKEHKNKWINTNPSCLLPWLSASQLYLWLKASHSYSGETHVWQGLLDHWKCYCAIWMLSASLSCHCVTCLVDTSGLEHRFHPMLSKQWLSLSYGARGTSPPSPVHSLMPPLYTWTALGWRVWSTVKGKLGVCYIEILIQISPLEIYA